MASPPVPGQKVAVDGCLMARLPQVLHTPENQPETRRLWKASGSLHYCVTRRVLLASGESINKREDNMARDKRVTRQLHRQGWKVIRIWQHSLEKSPDACLNRIRRALMAVT